MSVTGFWVVGVVPDAEVVRLQRECPGADSFGSHGVERGGDLAWWRDRGEQEPFFVPGPHGPVPTEKALRLQEAVDLMRPPDERHEAIEEQLLQLVPQHESTDLFCASTRKGDPFAALIYALGPEATSQLPGRGGAFLLDAVGARAALPGTEATLGLSPERRVRVEARVREWLEGMTGGAAHDLDDLVDGPLRVLRRAVEHGRGVAGMTMWC